MAESFEKFPEAVQEIDKTDIEIDVVPKKKAGTNKSNSSLTLLALS